MLTDSLHCPVTGLRRETYKSYPPAPERSLAEKTSERASLPGIWNRVSSVLTVSGNIRKKSSREMRFCAFTCTRDTRVIIFKPACARRRAVSTARDIEESASAAALPRISTAAGKSYSRQRESAALILLETSRRRLSGASVMALRSESTLAIRRSSALRPASVSAAGAVSASTFPILWSWARATPDPASRTMQVSANNRTARISIIRINGQNVLQK